MIFVRVLMYLAATYYWPLHQLDIKNFFINGILDEKVYMKQARGFLAQERVCENLHVEKVTLQSETISKSLVGALH